MRRFITVVVSALFLVGLGIQLGAKPIGGGSHRQTQIEMKPYGGLYHQAVDIQTPLSQEEVQYWVRVARAEKRSIMAAGARMSQGKQAVPHARQADVLPLVLDMRRMNKIKIEISPDGQSASAIVGAGATWDQLQQAANPLGWAVRVAQASPIFTVGGSAAINCHGWDHHHCPLSNTIESVTMVLASGEVVTVTPENELFQCTLGGMGLFGVMTEFRIALCKNCHMIMSGVEVKPEDYVAYAREHIIGDPNVLMTRYRLSLDPDHLFESGLSIEYRADAAKDAEGPVVSPDLRVEPARGTYLQRLALSAGRLFPAVRRAYWNKEVRDAIEPQELTRNEAMRPPINAIFKYAKGSSDWLEEFFVPGDQLAPFLEFLGQILQEHDVPLLNASVRYIPADHSTRFGYAKGRERFAVVLFFDQPLTKKKIEETGAWVRTVLDALHDRFHGTYYLPYQHFATVEQFRQLYPDWQEWAAAKKHWDPEELFWSGFYEDYLGRDSSAAS